MISQSQTTHMSNHMEMFYNALNDTHSSKDKHAILSRVLCDAIAKGTELYLHVNVLKNRAFYVAIQNNDVNMLQWFLSIVDRQGGFFNIHMNRELMLLLACRRGNICVINTLLSWMYHKKNHPRRFIKHLFESINFENIDVAKLLIEYLRLIKKEDALFKELCEILSMPPQNIFDLCDMSVGLRIIRFMQSYNPLYHFSYKDCRVVHWHIEDKFDKISLEELDKYFSLVKVPDIETECQICCESYASAKVSVYMLPCSKPESDHILCGICISRIRNGNTMQCPICTLSFDLYDK